MVPSFTAYNPLEHKGKLKRVSPCEFLHIALGGMYLCVKNGRSDEDKKLWQMARRNITFKFVKLTPEEEQAGLSIYAMNLREKLTIAVEQSGWGTHQRIEFVIQEKHTLSMRLCKQVREPDLTKHLRAVQLAASSEPMNKAFVDAALTVQARFLALEECREVFAEFDNMADISFKGPLDSVYKVNTIISRGRDEATIIWIAKALLDQFKTTFLTTSHFSITQLNTVYCDVAILQLEFRDYLFKWLDRMGFKHEFNHKTRELLRGHDSCRRNLQLYPGQTGNLDFAWLFDWPTSSYTALKVGQACFT